MGLDGATVLYGSATELRATSDYDFSAVNVLALTAEPEVLKKRMTEGRGIDDEKWIQSSIEYNNS